MKSGDIVTVALPGDTGKPRPAMVLISDDMAVLTHRFVVIPMTTTLVDASAFRVDVFALPGSGLRKRSQLMIDRVTTAAREKIGPRIGEVDDNTLAQATQRLMSFIGA